MKHYVFKDRVQTHLGECYNTSGKDGIYVYRHTEVSHKHILPIKNDTKQAQWEAIKQFALLRKTKELALKNEHIDKHFVKHLHSKAHHLTSSQVMCYNFFRPLIDEPELLKSVFQQWCPIPTADQLTAKFEYLADKEEKTNYDFYMGNNNVHIYCEIKYTEDDFGKKTGAKDFEQRVKFYENLLQVTSKQLWIKTDIKDCLTHHYQLFRNALSAKGPNDYVFFICPKDREDLKSSYERFAEVYLSTYGRQHVQFLTWEDLVNRARLIFEKNQTFFDDFEKMYLKW